MKNFILSLITLFSICIFSSCEKLSNKIEITNVSGTSFYDCQIWFRTGSDGDLIDYIEVGNWMMGESVKVKKLGDHCYIYAKDVRGNLVMSKTLEAYDGLRIDKYDLY